MNRKTIAIGALSVFLLTAGVVSAHMEGNPVESRTTSWMPWQLWDTLRGYGGMMGPGMGYGHGMMDNGMNFNTPGNYGGMMGPGMGYGHGMMGQNMMGYFSCPMNGYQPTAKQNASLTPDEVRSLAQAYIKNTGYQGLEIDEIYEFATHFEVEVEEEDTGIHAIELLIDKNTGIIRPEMGPNMMWNTRYGPMPYTAGEMRITPEEAVSLAKEYIQQNNPELSVEETPETYYGFYEVHATKNGKPVAQININGYNGAVWLEQWHGELIREIE